MNREIKFRGKSLINIGNIKEGDWVYGGITYNNDRVWIDIPYIGEVLIYPDTVGQFTGLYDNAKKEIYEGDIVKVNDEIIAEVIWENDYLGYFLYVNEENSIDSFENGEQPLYDYWGSIEVIGNIYDNPELLGGE